jgi:Rrf2 family protein
MIYSKTCEVAIRALTYYAKHQDAKAVSVKDVGREAGVSPTYVAKIFQCLVKSGILASVRGPAGGFVLLVPPSRLTLLQIVTALDDPQKSPFTNCVMGFNKCDDKTPCPLHPVWSKAKERMREQLHTCTLAEIAGLKNRFRLGRQKKHVLSKQMREVFSL